MRASWTPPSFPYSTGAWGTYTVWQYSSGGSLDRNTAQVDRAGWLRLAGKSDTSKYGTTIAGSDRYATSESVMKHLKKTAGAIANGAGFADAATIMWQAGVKKLGFKFASGSIATVESCRFGGKDRHQTQEIALAVAKIIGLEVPKKCFVVGDGAEADAAICSEASYRLGIPIMFESSDLSAFTEKVKVGGTYPNRDETAINFCEEYATDWSTVWLCAHDSWVDMMAAAQRGDGTPMLFYGSAALEAIKKYKPKKLVFVGGITDAQKEAAWKASQ